MGQHFRGMLRPDQLYLWDWVFSEERQINRWHCRKRWADAHIPAADQRFSTRMLKPLDHRRRWVPGIKENGSNTTFQKPQERHDTLHATAAQERRNVSRNSSIDSVGATARS